MKLRMKSRAKLKPPSTQTHVLTACTFTFKGFVIYSEKSGAGRKIHVLLL